ncbi:hypothetical protein OAF75_00655 [Verrucomicrobiales bacterium]|nr:hypothetical protein [Verrucomicrobiales bacterium]MDB4721329.1 hypothetical protein [Verrucomicrobiales bacterium]MDB4737322.1 hypothetical protein [Verrucomicrobiales bacterium]|tara:strand:+ start:994 stop:1611 length:618 start_codon:yes stop_codon:yes gene_type:complete
MAKYEDENVLVIPRELFDEIGSFQGINFNITKYLPSFLDPSNNFFLPRESAEDDPRYKQIIPYAIFRNEDTLLRYVRGKKSGEQRLANKSSLGIGGHINQDDAEQSSLERDTYMTGVDREINEELELNCGYTQKAVALINDDSNEVGKVHIGVVHLFDLTGNDISPGESNIQDLQFLNKDKLIKERENLETWSQICLDNLDALLD